MQERKGLKEEEDSGDKLVCPEEQVQLVKTADLDHLAHLAELGSEAVQEPLVPLA